LKTLAIGGRHVGSGHPCLIIAEAGVNHDGDLGRAHALIDAAADAGADVVKFQSFVAGEIVTRLAPKADYQHLSAAPGESQYEMLRRLQLKANAEKELLDHCTRLGVLFLSTPYDRSSVDRLALLGIPAYKISSTDATNLPYLEYVAAQGRPVILSTGMCDLDEVRTALAALRRHGGTDVALLHCTSEYPATVEEANLRAIATMEQAFGCCVGFSDHTPGVGAAPWAVAAGACIVEKHFTLDRTAPGPDHASSLEPASFRELVQTIRHVETVLGHGIKAPTATERINKVVFRKSLVARRPIAAGETIDAAAVTCKRPGTGLDPGLSDRVIGRRAMRPIAEDEVLTADAIAWD
jgi:N,N'-diacetyllegionaminate synthase